MAAESQRIRSYDIARALAILGMVVVNYSSTMQVDVYPRPWLESAVVFLYGRAATLFVMLAGVSVALMAGRCSTGDQVRALRLRLLKRCALLLVCGIVLWHWWDADILHYYAAYIAIGAWLAFWPDKKLGRAALAVVLVSIPVSATLTVAYDLNDQVLPFGSDGIVAQLISSYLAGDYYTLLPWMSFFLAGMLLGRREPAGRDFYKRCVWLGLVVCIGIELFSAWMQSWIYDLDWEIEGNWWLTFLRSDAFPVTPLFLFSSGAGAVAVIGLCRLAADAPRMLRVFEPLAVFGRFSLSMYIAHLFWGFGFIIWLHGSSADISAGRMFLAVGSFYVVGIGFAWLWQCRFQRGPLETIFHYLTRGRTMRLAVPAACPVPAAHTAAVKKRL